MKVCECYDKWGESSPDCEWGFNPKHGNEIYCPACKPIAQRARIRTAVQRFRGFKNLDSLVESTDREWLASWICKTCSNCGKKGVPTFNRFLCYACWRIAETDGDRYEVHPPEDYRESHNMDLTPREGMFHGEVKHYSSEDYTQEQLQAILRG